MTVDFSAFTQPVTSAQVKEFKKWARSSGTPGYNTTGMVVGGLVAAFVVFTVLSFIAGAVLPPADGTIIPSLLLFAVILGMAVLAFLVVLASTRKWESWFRLSSFAQHNGFLFSPKSDAPYYPGMIFTQGRSRAALDHIRAISGRYFDIGNFRYIVGSGKNQRTYNWGFLAFKLDRALPHMLLDATSNNSLFGSNLPTLFSKEQVLSLEGDFNKYFTLYCPREYERDALYVFTPDLMALLIDEAAPFDVEIIDDWMFVYSSKTFSTAAPGNYERMFRVIETVGAKTLSQTDHYSDERVAGFAANVVAPPGRRLRTRVSVFAIILFVLFVGVGLASFIGDILH